MMAGCNYIGSEEINRRKTKSDYINDTDDLTFAESKKRSSHGEAAKKVREEKDRLEIKRLERSDNYDYYNELLKDGY